MRPIGIPERGEENLRAIEPILVYASLPQAPTLQTYAPAHVCGQVERELELRMLGEVRMTEEAVRGPLAR
jgi:hypothetical protein